MRQRMPQTHIVLEGLLPRADMGLYGLGCRHAVAKQLGLAKHLHPPNKRSQPFVPGPPQPPSGSACMRFTCNMLAAMDACASAPGHCAAVQKLAQSDPLMHYVYCGDSFLTASGETASCGFG